MTAAEMVDEVEAGEAEVVDEEAEEVTQEVATSTMVTGNHQVTLTLTNIMNLKNPTLLAMILMSVQTLQCSAI